MGIGFKSSAHQAIVADIADEVMLGMDLMKKFGFILDQKNGILRVENEEVPIHRENDNLFLVILTNDVTLSRQSKKIVIARMDGKF